MKKASFLSLLMFFVCNVLYSMDGQSTTMLIIPDQNGCCGSSIVVQKIKGVNGVLVSTPQQPFCDLGQSYCQKKLDETIQLRSDARFIIHASSQGTATAVLYASKNPDKVKELFLEAMLASGNSAIYHTITGRKGIPALANIPGLYYIAPFIAKVIYPFYNVAGEQAIEAVSKIKNNIPVLIYHSTDDPQLSIGDAQAMYYKLRSQGNKNAFFVPFNIKAHIHLLYSDLTLENERVKCIIKSGGDLSQIPNGIKEFCQPDYEPFKKNYDDMIYKEIIIKRISKGLTVASWISLLFFVNRFYPFMYHFQEKFVNFAQKIN